MIRFRRLSLLPVDVFFVALSHVMAYLVRFEWSLPQDQMPALWAGLLVAVAVKPAFFWSAGFYRRLWRYASIPDLVHIVRTVFVASLAATLITLFLTHFEGYSRAVPVLDWLIP
ncbi:MAG: polysaccharide biosynthesis protein, partial [Proteobacteria bacterium]|nr:polysaccharide biosynthesis protein [Pseudomonadota bacterium]